MRYSPRQPDPLFESLEPLIRQLAMIPVDLKVSRHQGAVQVRLTVYRENGGATALEDCERVHRTVLPRLELSFPPEALTVEVSSPGIDRLIKDGAELAHYKGRGIRCYRTDISAWTGGILVSADERGLVLQGKEGVVELMYETIAKAKLDYSQEVYLRGN